MAFPGTYNINYYKGDTYEFVIYPKDTAGNALTLTDYTVKFTVSSSRGAAGVATQQECYTSKDTVNGSILCVIRPADSASFVAGTTYVYDVEISKAGTSYPVNYTILTGSVSVTEQVTGASNTPAPETPSKAILSEVTPLMMPEEYNSISIGLMGTLTTAVDTYQYMPGNIVRLYGGSNTSEYALVTITSISTDMMNPSQYLVGYTISSITPSSGFTIPMLTIRNMAYYASDN